MSKNFEKRRKRLIGGLAILLSASLSLGIVSACTTPETEPEQEDKLASATDTQLLKNGNFEFYGEMDEEDRDERRAFVSTPNDWSFSSGSPSSLTTSGIVNTADWDYMTKSTYSLVPAEEDRENDPELTDAAAQNAIDHWDEASVYDRLEFYDYYDIDSASEFSLYSDYRYSNDFEDLEYLHEVAVSADKPLLYAKEGREDGDSNILMIHNRQTSDSVRGTAQYYTSSTTVTLHAGTAAKVSVWVRTSELYHYAATANGENDVEVTRRAGAYIGVTNTVGGNSLDQMQIKNINTKDAWQKYTVYIRANTFATTTFRIVLGLGQGSSDNRYEAVDGYAFFDDVECEIISDKAYTEAVEANNLKLPGKNFCDLDSKGDEKKFFATDNTTGEQTEYDTYALDLHTGFEAYDFGDESETRFGLTEEVSGSKTYTSADIDSSLYDSTNDTENADKKNIADFLTYQEISSTGNGYLRDIFENDFKDNFPFYTADGKIDETMPVIMLLSTNGAAYTAKLPTVRVEPNSRMLVSFFVKTSKIRSGKTGASAILYDSGNQNGTISAFDSTTVAPVDIESDSDDPALKDIYKGWVQCFFFVQNDTDDFKEFRIELTYGPTAVASSAKTDYADGYAAFTNFQQRNLTKSQYSYAATGTYAQKVSLTASVKDSSKFDDASANGPTLEEGLAIPVNYTGVLAGSNILVDSKVDENGETNKNPNRADLAEKYGIYTGLLSSEYAKNYLDTEAEAGETVPAWKTALNTIAGNTTDPDLWWKTIFGNNGSNSDAAYRPLVILNTSGAAQPSYGFFASSTNVAASGASRISVRVKLSANATAYVYLTDVSDVKKGYNNRLAPTLPKVTYWYDDEGNIVSKDPSSEEFDEKKDILYTLEENGLYKKVGDTSDTYYANLSAFERDEDHNYVTKAGAVAFYHDPDDTDENTAYAYYDKTTDKYSQKVSPLPATEGVRYPDYVGLNPSEYEAVIKIEGSQENADRWIDVSFYVQTGNAQKDYRLELWAGERGNEKDGIPKDGYVFFDRCKTESVSNYSTLLQASASAIKDKLGIAEKKNLPAKDGDSPLALYYTFTFFDSPDYLRYDKTQDEDGLGNPWGSYEQSAHTEQLMWLYCEDDGTLLGTASPSVSLFLSYAANEMTVTPDELGDTDADDGSNDSDTSTNNGLGETNIWLLLSSILLAAALVFTMIAVFVRRIRRSRKKSATVPKAPKQKRAPKPKKAEAPAEEEQPEKVEKPVDENDPYNE